MSNCGTCKHWGTKENKGEVYRPCSAVVHSERSYHDSDVYSLADYEGDDEYNRDTREAIIAIRKHRAVVVDGSGYFAALKCREDFGCVLWTPPAE